ncbi:MAG: hypothetical protein RL706_952 [Pseudomonadota bacterium]|jgi:hypothetical protein
MPQTLKAVPLVLPLARPHLLSLPLRAVHQPVQPLRTQGVHRPLPNPVPRLRQLHAVLPVLAIETC